jgi:hypothetical protein
VPHSNWLTWYASTISAAFEAYWEVPGDETTAINGRWVNGPGAELFEAVPAGFGRPAHCSRESRSDYSGGGGSAPETRLSGHGCSPICIRLRRVRLRVLATQLLTQLAGLYGNTRQRHDSGLVEQHG